MKFRKIKKKPLIFLLVLCLLGIVGTTFAYYYTEIAIPNQFKAMTYNVTIEEEFNDTWGTKKVSFVNNEETNAPVVLRINYNEAWRKKINGVNVSLDNNIFCFFTFTKEAFILCHCNKISKWRVYNIVCRNTLYRLSVLV